MQKPVLIVDDAPDDRELIVEALKSAGVRHALEQAAGGREALARLESPPAPCLVLLDIKMPVVDGFEVLARLRGGAQPRTLPVVMLTGSAQTRDIERAYELGANAFLVKPASFESLVAMAAAVRTFWLEFNVPSCPPA